MNIVLFSHPTFLDSKSMPHFARMLYEGLVAKGHKVKVWTPQPKLHRLVAKSHASKWAGYIDQYILFPLWVRKQLKTQPADTLYVFCDQALGPWVPLVKNKPHVVHVHDMLALCSALGHIQENSTRWSGRIYQRYIRQGFRQAKHFISVSNKTRDDLHCFGQISAASSHVVYNSLNYPYAPMSRFDAIHLLMDAGLPNEPDGILLQVGSVWYKNLAGVIRIYIEYAKVEKNPLPLWCIATSHDADVQALLKLVPANGKVLFFQNLDNEVMRAAYSLARAFIFPSLAEGFGWPIIEAQACGCPVITTDAPPMNEIGGSHSIYLPLLKANDDAEFWAMNGSQVLKKLLNLDEIERNNISLQCLDWASRFDSNVAIEGYLNIYRNVLPFESP